MNAALCQGVDWSEMTFNVQSAEACVELVVYLKCFS